MSYVLVYLASNRNVLPEPIVTNSSGWFSYVVLPHGFASDGDSSEALIDGSMDVDHEYPEYTEPAKYGL